MKRSYKIAVIDYKISNMFSIRNALDLLGFNCEVTSDRSTILTADGAILPGVGSFPEAMKNINNLGFDETIKDFIKSGKPFIGICLGFQLLFDKSTEIQNTLGLGIIHGQVEKMPRNNTIMRVPHVGWNSIKKNKKYNHLKTFHPLKNHNDEEFFYFIHSYYVSPEDQNNVYTISKYGDFEFCSSILKDNIFACQFHPEKSGKKGLQILEAMFNQK